MVSVLDSDREVQVQALAGSLCCVLGQNTLLSQCLSPSRSINGYQQNFQGNLTEYWGVTCNEQASHPGGVAILLVTSCYGNQDKLQ